MKRGIWGTGGFAAILSGLVAMGGIALAQHSGAAPQKAQPEVAKDKKIFTNKSKFHLPVRIDDRVRANLREVCLYVKHSPGDWVRQEVAGPQQTSFSYNPTQDGEYWFSIVMVDRAGKATPADVNSVPPALKVVVDTKAPVVDLQPWTAPDGEVCIRCMVQDANPDYSTLKLTYRGADQAERTLEAKPNMAGVYRIPSADVWSGPVRLNMTDRCGNNTTREVQLANPVATAAAPKHAVPPPLPSALKTEPLPPVTAQAPRMADVPPLPPETPKAVPPSQPQVLPVDYTAPSVPPPPVTQPETKSAPAQQTTVSHSSAAAHDKLVLNTTRCALDYRIDQVGPSGVGKVEVYITTDQGNTWRRLCEDADRRSPIEMDLPGEGVYGVRLVIANGNGFGGAPPVRGDVPSSWVEVDTTNPLVQLRDVEPVLAKDGSLEIRWMASDRNLRSECVNLYFTTNRTGPWQCIAKNVKNDGVYRWAFPRDVNAPIFLRVEVCDQAGNIARSDSAQAIALDTTEPRGTVLGITPITARPTQPTPVAVHGGVGP